MVGEFYTGKHGFIDKTGKYYFDLPFIYVSSFSEGLACVTVGDNKGFIDKTGRFVFYCQYDTPGDFKEGMSRVSIIKDDFTNGKPIRISEKHGFIDRTGRCVISPQFDEANDFSEGLACVRIGGKYGVGRYGFIDKSGTYTINPQFEYADSFKGGIAPVVNDGRFLYIDKRGNIIWSNAEVPQYITESIAWIEMVYNGLYSRQ